MEVALLQHQYDLIDVALHHIRRRRRRRRLEFWVRPWIGRRWQFGLYDQLLVELRQEDQRSFKNFMRMPPDMFDELLARVGPRITKQTTRYREPQSGAWSEACTDFTSPCLWEHICSHEVRMEGPPQYPVTRRQNRQFVTCCWCATHRLLKRYSYATHTLLIR